MRLITIFCVAVFSSLCLWQCSGGGSSTGVETVEVRDSVYGYVERFERKKEDFARQGLYEKFSEDGKKIETAYYESDSLNGLRIVFFENGDTQIVESYKMGAFEGPYRLYHENGQMELEGQYVDNAMKGAWKRYYENGALMEVVQFENNAENGPFVEYHPNGKLKAEGAYLEGDNEHGELKLYNEEGELVRIMNCDHGICRTQWKAEGEE